MTSAVSCSWPSMRYVPRSAPHSQSLFGNQRPQQNLTTGVWATLNTPTLANFTAEEEFYALSNHLQPYRPFHLEANDFFELPMTKLQLVQRAAEKGYKNPIWLRSDTLRTLNLFAAPFEVPTPIWLPQCGDTYRPLEVLLPKVQHVILKDHPVSTTVPDQTHVVLALDYYTILKDLARFQSPMLGAGSLDVSMMTKRNFAWQTVTPQFTEMFDAAYDVCHPIIQRQYRTSNQSRISKRDTPPRHPRQKMWVSLGGAMRCHVEAMRCCSSLPMQSITVNTPLFGGLFFNASQLYPDRFLTEKTNEVLQRCVQQNMKENDPTNAGYMLRSPSTLRSLQMAHESGVWSNVSERTSAQSTADAASYVDATSTGLLVGETLHDEFPADSADAVMSLFGDDDLPVELQDAAPSAVGTMNQLVVGGEVEDVDAAAEEDIAAARDLTPEDEFFLHSEFQSSDKHGAETVVVDAAAAQDGDSPSSFPAELELVQQALDTIALIENVGDLEVEEFPALDVVVEQEGFQSQATAVPRDATVIGATYSSSSSPILSSHSLRNEDVLPETKFECGGAE